MGRGEVEGINEIDDDDEVARRTAAWVERVAHHPRQGVGHERVLEVLDGVRREI